MKRIWIQDIDGCLNDYPNEFIQWSIAKYELNISTIEEMKEKLTSEKYKIIKDDYRKSGFKRELKLNHGASDTLEKIHNSHEIWILTSRPKIHNIEEDTIHWLKKHKVSFDRIIFEKNKLEYLKNFSHQIDYIIDDDLAHCNSYLDNLNCEIILMDWHNKHDSSNIDSRIHLCKTWADVDKVYQLKKNISKT